MIKKKAQFAFEFVNLNLNLSHSKAQMKIQQMAFFLVAVFLFFILAGLFWLSLRYAGLHEEATRLEEEKAITSVLKLAETAEFSCSEAGQIRERCIDADKILVLGTISKSYGNFWPVKSIYVYKLDSDTEKRCNLANYPNCNVFEIYGGEGEEIGVSSFVALCRKKQGDTGVYDKCELAKLVVSFETK